MATRRSRWSRRAGLVTAVGVVVVVALDAGRATPAARTDARPNVVVVLVDDMGWSDIGPYGGEIPTPNLDALAGRGVRFTQFYSTPRCSPSRASLLTGVYPHQAGMGHLDNVVRPRSSGTTGRLNDRSVTIAEVLREAGYFTAMSGKWHLGQDNGSPPWQRGFDRVLSLRAGGMYFPNQNFRGGDDALTARAREPLYLDGTPTPRDAAVFGVNWYATYLWTDFGLRFIDDARKANKPFFLYLPYNAPHFPLMAPAELIARHRGRYKAGWDRRRQIAMGLIDGRWPLSPRDPASPAWDSLTDDAKDRFDHLMAVYSAMIEAIDTSIGRLVKGLEARGALGAKISPRYRRVRVAFEVDELAVPDVQQLAASHGAVGTYRGDHLGPLELPAEWDGGGAQRSGLQSQGEQAGERGACRTPGRSRPHTSESPECCSLVDVTLPGRGCSASRSGSPAGFDQLPGRKGPLDSARSRRPESPRPEPLWERIE